MVLTSWSRVPGIEFSGEKVECVDEDSWMKRDFGPRKYWGFVGRVVGAQLWFAM